MFMRFEGTPGHFTGDHAAYAVLVEVKALPILPYDITPVRRRAGKPARRRGEWAEVKPERGGGLADELYLDDERDACTGRRPADARHRTLPGQTDMVKPKPSPPC